MADEILNNENTEDVLPEPILREEKYLSAIANNTAGGGGGGKVVIAEKTITANGTYNAVDDNANAYNPVTVNVANSYTAGDEGKVVSSGELVAQTSRNLSGEGTYDTTLNNSVTVSLPQPPTESDVNFYDYDGTLLYSYTAQEFLALDAMPANPSHSGLTAEGWNWTLSDAKAQVTASVKCDIGQTYTTDDGCTRIYITLGDANLGWDGLSLYLRLRGHKSEQSSNVTIDWGDNSSTETFNTNLYTPIYTPHTYATSGDYVISIKVNSGTIDLTGNINYPYYSALLTSDGSESPNKITCQNTIRKIEIGNNVIATTAFNYLYNLKTITIPNSVTKIGTGEYMGGAMMGNSNLEFVVLPNSINTISRQCFSDCYKLKKVSIPNSVTTLGGDIFRNCSSLSSIVLPNSINTLTAGGNQFNYCYSLKSVTLSNSMTIVDGNMFNNCKSLENIVIPDSIATIEIIGIRGLLYTIKFISSTPPTLTVSSTTSNGSIVPQSYTKIYVPSGSLTAYTTASNYPDPNTYQYIEY